MSQYNKQNNYNNIDLVLPFINYWDYELTPNQYIPNYLYSSNIVNDNLIFNFDFNSSDTILNINDGIVRYIETPTFSSKQYTSGFTLNDVGLTSINFGGDLDVTNIVVGVNSPDYPVLGQYTSSTISFTGETLNFISGNTNLKLWLSFPNGTTNFDYPVKLSNDFSGDYINFGGGFFNGFYKLYGYPYQLIQKRFNRGWTTQLNLNTYYSADLFDEYYKLRVNDVFTGNTGFFLYFGVRQENKFYDSFTGITSQAFNTFLSGISTNFIHATSDNLRTTTGISLDPYKEIMENNVIQNNMLIPGYGTCGCGSSCSNCNQYYDWSYNPVIWSGITDNVLGFRLTPDFRLGYRRIITNTYCVLTSFTETNRCGELITSSGYTEITTPKIIEEYSPTPIFTGYTCSECDPGILSTWINLTIKWERDYPYNTDCELEYGKYKNGTLKTYINGRPFWNVTGFTEFIPYELPTDPSKQEGVPFTISLGGGSIGLLESQVSSYKETNIIWDNVNSTWDNFDVDWDDDNYEDFNPYSLYIGKYSGGTNNNLWIQNYFAGSYMGGISSFKMYETPLSIGEIRHNYLVEKCRYKFKGNFGGRVIVLPDYKCETLPCLPTYVSNDIIVNPNNNDYLSINNDDYLTI